MSDDDKITEARANLRTALFALETSRGDSAQLGNARDELVVALGVTEFKGEDGHRTAFPHTRKEEWTFPPLPQDEMGRVLVQPEDLSAVNSEHWARTTDRITGLRIDMRRADCGAGCRCATEVRLIPMAVRG